MLKQQNKVLLPGYSARNLQCWKCRGSGQNPRNENARCNVCGGSGTMAIRPRSTNVGRVTEGPRNGDKNCIGPEPVGNDHPESGIDLCCLSGRWRIFQRQRGHRYSTEDVVTAWVASRLFLPEDMEDTKILHIDLGSGIGSVLLFIAWQASIQNRNYQGLSVEAQEDSWQLARRSIAYNGAPCEAILGDLRCFSQHTHLETFLTAAQDNNDVLLLITGTPPYFRVETSNLAQTTTRYGALPSCEQSAGARYEFRGGIEEYCLAAAAIIRRTRSRNARFVCCEGGLDYNRHRVDSAAHQAGLRILNRQFVIGREGKPPLFGVWTMALHSSCVHSESTLEGPVIIVRDRAGNRTPEYTKLLQDMAMLR